jgi:hypothetical protein
MQLQLKYLNTVQSVLPYFSIITAPGQVQPGHAAAPTLQPSRSSQRANFSFRLYILFHDKNPRPQEKISTVFKEVQKTKRKKQQYFPLVLETGVIEEICESREKVRNCF